MKQKTIFSSDRVYRYKLWRTWQQELGVHTSNDRKGQFVMFIGLNPSIADEEESDHTLRRCIGFAKSWNYHALCIVNLFAFVATDPKVMKQQENPVGDNNLFHLIECGLEAEEVVAAWGVAGVFRNQDLSVWKALSEKGIDLFHLGLTKHGLPKHPSRLPSDVKLQPFKPKRDARFDKWKSSM